MTPFLRRGLLVALVAVAVLASVGGGAQARFLTQVVWKQSPRWTGGEIGPRDGNGNAWFSAQFDDGNWKSATLPRHTDAGRDGFDEYFRGTFSWDGSSRTEVSFQSDDGLTIYVNGRRLGSWGNGWRQSGCVNIVECGGNETVPNQPISAKLLHHGENLIAVDVWNGSDGCCGFTLGVRVLEATAEIKYRIHDDITVDEHEDKLKMIAINTKIEKATAAVNNAKAALAEAQRMLDLRKADAVNVTATVADLTKKRDEAETAYAEYEHRFTSAGVHKDEEQKLHGAALADAAAKAEKAVEVKMPLLEHVLRDERSAATAYANAVEKKQAAQQALGQLEVERLRLAGKSTIQKVTVHANGRIVFVATSAHMQLADNLQPILDALAKTEDQLAGYDLRHSNAEAALISAADARAKANEELYDQIWSRGYTNALVDGIGVLKDSITGAVEGGPWGALAAAEISYFKSRAGALLESDPDVVKEISAALDKDTKLPTYAQPTVGGVIADGAKSQALPTAAGAIWDLATPLLEEIKNYPIVPLPTPDVPRHFRAVLGKSITAQDRVLRGLEETLIAVKRLGTKAAWQEFAREQKVNLFTVGGGVGIAVDLAGAVAKADAKAKEAQAWANFLVLARVEDAIRQLYLDLGQECRNIRAIRTALLGKEAELLDKARATRSGFRVHTNVPFVEGSKLAITTSPSLTSFGHVQGEVGGERALYDGSSGELTLTARGLASSGGDPRLVQLTLEVGR